MNRRISRVTGVAGLAAVMATAAACSCSAGRPPAPHCGPLLMAVWENGGWLCVPDLNRNGLDDRTERASRTGVRTPLRTGPTAVPLAPTIRPATPAARPATPAGHVPSVRPVSPPHRITPPKSLSKPSTGRNGGRR